MNAQERLAQRCNELERRIAALETLEATMAHIYGWDGSAWRKLPMVWGYSERWYEVLYEADASAPADDLQTTAVPSGEVYVLQAVSVQWNGTSCSSLSVALYVGTDRVFLLEQLNPTDEHWYTWSGEACLEEGDEVIADYEGLTAGDDLRLRVWGYKMKVSE